MRLDNTAFGMYMACPLKYFERYEADQIDVQRPQDRGSLIQIQGADGAGATALRNLELHKPGSLSGPAHAGDGKGVSQSSARGIELDEPNEGRDFGSRFHQLLHERRLGQLGTKFEPEREWPDEDIEAEAQATLAAYEAHYIRDYEYLESERTHILDLPDRCPTCWAPGVRSYDLPDDQRWCNTCNRAFGLHQLVVKLDAVVRHADKTLGPFDTKTESRQGYNSREDWSKKTQGQAYLYALSTLYPTQRVSRLVVDVVTRGSPKARRGPVFTRLDDITHSPASIDEFLRNVVWTCDDIERSRKLGWWRSNTNLCKKGWEKCDYFFIHVDGRTDANLRKYRPAEAYLDL